MDDRVIDYFKVEINYITCARDLSALNATDTLSSRSPRLFVRKSKPVGIVSAAAMKHDGGDRVILVGEDVADRLRFWSEGKPVCLPNSDLCLHPTTGLWDLEKGCKGEPESTETSSMPRYRLGKVLGYVFILPPYS